MAEGMPSLRPQNWRAEGWRKEATQDRRHARPQADARPFRTRTQVGILLYSRIGAYDRSVYFLDFLQVAIRWRPLALSTQKALFYAIG